MPFTFSHPAIVLPLIRRYGKWFSATGLIVGSMAPDFESFIAATDIKFITHRWYFMPIAHSKFFVPVAPFIDVPLALLLACVFHFFIRDVLIAHLPAPLEERFSKYRNFDWWAFLKSHFLIVLLSLLVGVLSHLLWDAFTHLNLYYPGSRRSQWKIHGKRVFKMLQFICSVIGLAIMVWAVYKMPRKKRIGPAVIKPLYWVVVALVSILIAVIFIDLIYNDMVIWKTMYVYIGMSSLMYSILVVSAVYKYLNPALCNDEVG